MPPPPFVNLYMIINKITLLNETTLECLNKSNEVSIVKRFTEVGIKILGADFGFVWLNSPLSTDLNLVYKSPNITFMPHPPRKKGRNYTAMKKGVPDFISETDKAIDAHYVSKYVKSFVIIPIVYKKNVYGSMVFCFKKPESFSKDKRALSVFIGNSVAQVFTINRLILSELSIRTLSKKQEAHFKALIEEEKFKIQSIADATHELRTPLAIIKGNVDLAIKKLKSKKSVFSAISQEIDHLSNIVSDLATITSAGVQLKNKVNFSKVNLKELVLNATTRCRALAHKRGISIKTSNILNVFISGDKFYLEKMFVNLIRNSIIYGKKNGHTKIDFKKTESSITINVVDDGIGISPEALPHVFERFFKADKSHTYTENSTGLGLSIVKWIADIHNGVVNVKSVQGKGSVFTVTLPIK